MPALSGVEIVVSRKGQTNGGKAVWTAECAGLLPFVSETGDTPRAAVVRFLRRVANHYERHEHEPLPAGAVLIQPSRRRVTHIAAMGLGDAPKNIDELLGSRRPMEIIVTRRRVADMGDPTTHLYPYTMGRWMVLEEAFDREYGNSLARFDSGVLGFNDEGEEEE